MLTRKTLAQAEELENKMFGANRVGVAWTDTQLEKREEWDLPAVPSYVPAIQLRPDKCGFIGMKT